MRWRYEKENPCLGKGTAPFPACRRCGGADALYVCKFLFRQRLLWAVPRRMVFAGVERGFLEPPALFGEILELPGDLSGHCGGTGASVLSGGVWLLKFRFRGKEPLFFLLILMMMMPYQVTLVSNYLMLDKLGLVGSQWS